MCRLANPYRATTDLDLVDRLPGEMPPLQVLRAARGAQPVPPTSVLLPTVYGQVKVDVLEVRQIEIDQPSDDPGDRLHAFAHAWANDSATEVGIEVSPLSGAHVEVSAGRRTGSPGRHEVASHHESRCRQAGHGPARHRPADP
jgi:hypothetical protein